MLATASDQLHAKAICNYYTVFDSYISSDKDTNLKGISKLRKIKELSSRFSYAGNSSIDFVLFGECDESYLVRPTKSAKKRALKIPVTRTFDNTSNVLNSWVKQLRVHQWLKNLLVFTPLMVSGNFSDETSVILSLTGFLIF